MHSELSPSTVEAPPPGADVDSRGAEPRHGGEDGTTGSGPPARGSSGRWLLEWAAVIVLALLLAFGIRTFVAQMFYIPSGSMEPTLQIGDRIIVDKLSYHLHSVDRGDVVVFASPAIVRDEYADLVKRVIGLPGDRISLAGGHVYVDGKRLAEPWLRPELPGAGIPQTLPSPAAGAYSLRHPYTVPPGHYFVMGDNRTDSEDSRYFGAISGSLIVGKMAFVAWPLDSTGWLVLLGVALVVVLVAFGIVLWRSRRSTPDPERGPPGTAGTAGA